MDIWHRLALKSHLDKSGENVHLQVYVYLTDWFELCLVSWLVVNYYTVTTRLSVFNFHFTLLSIRNWQILRLVHKISYIFMILYFILFIYIIFIYITKSFISVGIIFLIDNYYDRNKIPNRLRIFNILSFSYFIYFT